jgi:hypothetical protein
MKSMADTITKSVIAPQRTGTANIEGDEAPKEPHMTLNIIVPVSTRGGHKKPMFNTDHLRMMMVNDEVPSNFNTPLHFYGYDVIEYFEEHKDCMLAVYFTYEVEQSKQYHVLGLRTNKHAAKHL